MLANQLGFVVEGIDLTESPTETDLNHPFGFGAMMGPGVIGFGGDSLRAGRVVPLQQMAKSHGSQSMGRPREKTTAIE